MNSDINRPDSERRNLILLIFLAAAKFLIHFAINITGAYGFFRDEFYYIACSEHLAFGYVDHPPLSIYLLKISRVIFGDSLVAIRFLPALAGALTVFLTGMIVKELGGKRFAMLFAALCVLLAPLHLGINSIFSMNSFDILIWTAATYILVKLVNRRDPRMWLWLGVILGLGLQNKISVLWLGFGLTVGLLLTENRRSYLTRGPWLAAGIALLIFLPHIIWQALNGWPTLEFMAGATGKMLEVSFLDYLGGQIMEMHPLLFPVWVTGLVWYLFAGRGKQYRVLGIIYVSIFALLVISGSARSSYLAPAYPMLFASGALVLERISTAPLMKYARWVGSSSTSGGNIYRIFNGPR
jgi:4-amino-4-deoxy-L-arabinose transferase-like glycosyltransferase